MLGYLSHRMPNTDTTLANARETVDALVKLLERLGPAIVFVHSQGGAYGMQLAVTAPHLLRALVNLEGAGRTPVGPATPEGIATAFGSAALLHVIGGHIEGTAWEAGLVEARKLAQAFIAQGKKSEVLFAEEQGMPGRTHMLMMDKGSLELAGWIAKWLDRNVR
jgi:pimeloyl-ACP methyl ester carboxylesterase